MVKRYLALIIIICMMACWMISPSSKGHIITPSVQSSDNERISLSQVTETPKTVQALETAMDVLIAIKNRDYQLLAEYAHPEKGIVFSPDPNVNYNEDKVFKAEQIKTFEFDTLYDWGYYDVSQVPLKLILQQTI